LQRDDVFREGYVNAVQSYIEKGYCRQIPTDEVSTNTTWYLTHHAVVNPRNPGKVRTVFDCASKWQGVSLNDVLLHSPDFASSLVGVLTRFRMHPVAVVADVQEMFHQVRVQQSDCDVLRFLCWPDGEFTKDPVDYQVVAHLLGFTCSPSIAVVFSSGSDLCERVLCVHWNVDRNAFGTSVEENGNVTRTVLSTICSSYNSFEFPPVTITANVFMYELCRRVASWDEPVPKDEKPEWKTWVNEFERLHDVRVPRCVKPSQNSQPVDVSSITSVMPLHERM